MGQNRDMAEQTVRNALQDLSEGQYTGSTEKNLERLGDSAAIELIRVIQGHDLSSSEIKNALLILEMSFASPRTIEIASDQKPRAALLLLRYLEYQTAEPELKNSIHQTKKSIEISAN
jgi:hypothetical protein